jgi:branched-chain amino acid transport system permease protein
MLAYSAYAGLSGGAFNLSFPAFAGLGGYGVAILTTKSGVAPIPAAFISVLLAVSVAAVFSVVLLRLRGVYMAIVSINLVVVFVAIANNWSSLTGGALGITGLPLAATTRTLMIGTVVIVAGFALISRGKFGESMTVMTADRTLAASLGMRVRRTQFILALASAALAAWAGAMNAFWLGLVTPSNYGFETSVAVIAMVILGGEGFWWGPLVGAAVFTAVPEWTRSLGTWQDLSTAAILLAVVIFAPEGIAGYVHRISGRVRMARSLVAQRRVGATNG